MRHQVRVRRGAGSAERFLEPVAPIEENLSKGRVGVELQIDVRMQLPCPRGHFTSFPAGTRSNFHASPPDRDHRAGAGRARLVVPSGRALVLTASASISALSGSRFASERPA